METLSALLKRKRKEIEWSAKDICDTLQRNYGIKIAPATLYGYENGHRNPDVQTVFALSDFYGISEDVMATFGYGTNSKLVKDNLKEQTHKMIDKLNYFGICRAHEYISDLLELEKYTFPDELPEDANSIPLDFDMENCSQNNQKKNTE